MTTTEKLVILEDVKAGKTPEGRPAGTRRMNTPQQSYVVRLTHVEALHVPETFPLIWHMGEHAYVMPSTPYLLARLQQLIASPIRPRKVAA